VFCVSQQHDILLMKKQLQTLRRMPPEMKPFEKGIHCICKQTTIIMYLVVQEAPDLLVSCI